MNDITKRALCVISEAGLHNLMVAGISTGWLKAWLISAGATSVSLALFESDIWQYDDAQWQLFFADDKELGIVMQQHGVCEIMQSASFKLDNPQRHCWHYSTEGKRLVLLSLGDIAFQRNQWLALLNDQQPLQPLYVQAGDDLPILLEPGLSAAVSKPDTEYLNSAGLMIEEQVITGLKANGLSIRTVESCTAGGIIARLCRVPGASEVVDRAWVTYTNTAKQQEVGVAADLLEKHGAVSEAVVRAMAEGGADASHVCIAVSGIAGPGGGTIEKPVGTVWIAVSIAGQETVSRCLRLSGSRHEIQSRTVVAALHLLLTEGRILLPNFRGLQGK